MKSSVNLTKKNAEKYLLEHKYCLNTMYKSNEENILISSIRYCKSNTNDWGTKIDILSGLFPNNDLN